MDFDLNQLLIIVCFTMTKFQAHLSILFLLVNSVRFQYAVANYVVKQ